MNKVRAAIELLKALSARQKQTPEVVALAAINLVEQTCGQDKEVRKLLEEFNIPVQPLDWK